MGHFFSDEPSTRSVVLVMNDMLICLVCSTSVIIVPVKISNFITLVVLGNVGVRDLNAILFTSYYHGICELWISS